MDARRTLTVGGGAAVATGLVIAGILAVGHAVALTDVAGAPISAAPVLLPSSSASGTGPATTRPPVVTPSPGKTAKTVPAPQPRDVGGSPDSSTTTPTPAKTTPPTENTRPTPSHTLPAEDDRTAAQVIAQFEKDGDIEAVKKWVAEKGWSAAKAKVWLKFVLDRYEKRHGSVGKHATTSSFSTSSQTPARAGSPSDPNLPRSWVGSKRGQSPEPSFRRD